MLGLPNGGACGEPAFLAELAHKAEAAGWEAVLIEDYIDYQAKDMPTCDPWIALADYAGAARASRTARGVAQRETPARSPRSSVASRHMRLPSWPDALW